MMKENQQQQKKSTRAQKETNKRTGVEGVQKHV